MWWWDPIESTARTLSVTARSIRLDAGRLQPEITERGELTELFTIFARLAGRVGISWPAASAPAGRGRGSSAPHPPLDAFENYIKGLLAESPMSQASFLEAALRDAPGFDRARLALWEVRTEQADHLGGTRCGPRCAIHVTLLVQRAVSSPASLSSS